MITKWFSAITVGLMLAAFFCAHALAYDLPVKPSEPIEGAQVAPEPVDKNYIYIGRFNGLDYFLDKFSIEIKKDNDSARSWTQFIFPIGENLPPGVVRSTSQTFFTDGEKAYNSSRRKLPIEDIKDDAAREFMMRCFTVGYENAFGEKFLNVTSQATTSAAVDGTMPIVKSNSTNEGDGIGMTNKNLTEIVFILDRSGSMSGMEPDTIGGFNSMLERQKAAEGEAFLTTILFDDKVEVLHDRLPIGEIKPITTEEYWVRGSTALLDAVGEAIRHIKTIHKYAREEDRPNKTIFCITTDGMENSSVRYSYRDVKQLIDAQKEKGWEFLFLGADIDSGEVAERMGIDRNRAANYRKDSQGSDMMYSAFSDAMTSMREVGSVEDSWKDEVEADERDRK